MSDSNASNEHAEIQIYVSQYCPYCTRAKGLLNAKGVAYDEVDIDAEPLRRSEMIEKSQGITSVPQIFIGQQHVGGCDEMFALENQNKLDELLFPES